jgi:predicted ATPase/DNA-binding SARP family transcriptional activator
VTGTSETDVRVAVLGPVLIEDRGQRLSEPASALGKSLIVALVLAPGRALNVRRLVEEIWEDNPPRGERAALQTLVSRLRSTLAPGILESTTTGYALAVAEAETDLGAAASRAAAARDARRRGDLASAVTEAERGLALWRAEAGSDLPDIALASDLAARAESVRTELRLLRATCRIDAGDAALAVPDLERLIAGAPLDEELRFQQLRALDAAGRRTDAISAFAAYRALLRDRLGTNPGERLLELNAELLRDESATPDGPPRDRDRSAGTRIGVRTPPNELIGRGQDVEHLEALVSSSRLTTILGPGGIGKTRLAQAVAGRAVDTPSVVVVELASVRSPDDVPLALASTLGIREASGSRVRAGEPGSRIDLRARILDALAERPTLLVVDNCEHLVDAAAAWISDILDSTTTVRVLATSRAPLSIGAERVFPVEPLASSAEALEEAPAAESGGIRAAARAHGPAVELFVERAQAARPTVVLPRVTVARLCARLDGLPLAIELAAARTRSMSVDEVERRLGHRFALLTGGERTAPERHRTLHAVIDWSWNLLTTREQLLLRRLSRFPDGFSLDAARAVASSDADEVADDLDALVSQSLVSVAEDERTGAIRYRMLETVREFGDLQLAAADDTETARERMFEWAMGFSRATLQRMDGSAQLAAIATVSAEQDNLVSILREALDASRPEVVVGVFGVLGYFWTIRGNHTEVLSFGPSIAAATRDYTPDVSDVVPAVATYTLLGGTMLFLDVRNAARILSRLRRLRRAHPVPDPRLDALSSLLLSSETRHGRFGLLEAYGSDPDPRISCLASLMMGSVHENAGDLTAALACATRAYESAVAIDEVWAISTAAQSIAQLYSQMARPDDAIEWANRARSGLEQLEAVGDMRQLDWLIAINSVSVGRKERGQEILERFARAEDDVLGFDFLDLRAIGFAGLGEIALSDGRAAEGLRLYREAVDVFGSSLSAPIPWLTIIVSAYIVARLRAGEVAGAPDDTDSLARALRTRLIVTARLRPASLDKPVLATGVIGVAAWVLLGSPARAADPDMLAAGAELFALAERLSSRQDVPSLRRDPLEATTRERHGDGLVDEARARVRGLSIDEATARALVLLRAVGR